MTQVESLEESSGMKLSYKTMLSSIGAIVVVVAGGTFALTKLSTSSHISALQTQLDGAKEREERKDAEIGALKSSAVDVIELPSRAVVLPEATLAAAGDSEVRDLALRIRDLESERTTLLNELAERSQDALNPQSELAALLKQLSADSPKVRMDAVRGLFELRDSIATTSLVAYFRKDPEEATRAKSLGEWFRLLYSLDEEVGLVFMINVLQSDESFYTQWAYEILSELRLSPKVLQKAIVQLESVALRSGETVVRARSKLLLQEFRNRLENPKDQPDPRGLYSILLDVEAEVKKLSKKMNESEHTDEAVNQELAPSAAP